MNKIKEDLLLHPVRLRILIGTAAREVTAQQLADEMPDIPQATLYRNIKTLTAAGFLTVVRERRVHNTVEKTYALAKQGLMLTPEDLKNATTEDYVRLITQYLGTLMGYYMRYIQRGEVDMSRDNVLLQMVPLYVSKGEAMQLGQALTTALQPFLMNQPSPDRQRLILGLTSIPDAAGTPASGSQAVDYPENEKK